MQLTYVFSELGNGLKRNISMTVAVITTIFVSLTLVGLGLLLNRQADLIENYWGDRLQITIFMCAPSSPEANCIDGKATEPQKAAVVKVLTGNPEVKDFRFETSEEAFTKFKQLYENKEGETSRAVLESVSAADFPESYWVTLNDPKKFQGVRSEVLGLKGVSEVRDLRNILKPLYTIISYLKVGAIVIAGFLVVAAILQVGNTIRLAAMARRREIGIMRLVGASSWYIQLPFLLESLFAALVGVGIATLAVLGFMGGVIYGILGDSTIIPWVAWGDAVWVIAFITALGVAMTVLPTLLLTRRYLRV